MVGHELDVQSLWEKYEDIAMHFNNLLMRLRSQALAGIAAISTLVGVFTKEGVTDAHMGWLVATAIFVALAFFWVAIWFVDILYYNRLLYGAVEALVDLESRLKKGEPITINMSTCIDSEFSRPLWKRKPSRFRGVLWFYVIVLAVIILGITFSWHMYCATN